jgi:hypothetical protein
MTMARTSRILALILAFAGGLLIGVFVAAARPRSPELHELSGEMLVEAKQAFKDYKAKSIKRHISVILLDGCELDVAIVREFREVDYGFAEIANLPRLFWLSRDGVAIYRYDNHHLFFALSDWYVAELEQTQPAQDLGRE